MDGRRLGVLILAAVLCAGAPTLAAAAPPTTFPGEAPFLGPVLAGDRAVWATGLAPPPIVAGFAVKTGALDGGAETLIADPDGRASGDPAFLSHDLAASGGHVAVHYPSTSGQRTLLFGARGVESLAEDCRAASLDLHGDLLAFAPVCGSVAATSVRDLSTGASQVVSGAIGDIQVAGRYVAWREPVFSHQPTLVVYDRHERREAYRVDVASLLPPTDYRVLFRFDLQPDGKVAVAYHRDGERAAVSWFSPAEPRPHPVADQVGGGLAMANDSIALKRYPEGADPEFAVVDLSGRTLQVFDHDDPEWGTNGIDFDGATLVWDSHRKGVRISRYPVEVDFVAERFAVVPSRFRAARRSSDRRRPTPAAGGALLRIRVNAPARLAVSIERFEGKFGPCGPTSPPPPACSVAQPVGRLSLGRRRGAVRHRFTGRLSGRRLPAGRYQAVILARRGSRAATRETAVPFRIVGR